MKNFINQLKRPKSTMSSWRYSTEILLQISYHGISTPDVVESGGGVLSFGTVIELLKLCDDFSVLCLSLTY